jgi:hypothetical protein
LPVLSVGEHVALRPLPGLQVRWQEQLTLVLRLLRLLQPLAHVQVGSVPVLSHEAVPPLQRVDQLMLSPSPRTPPPSAGPQRAQCQ